MTTQELYMQRCLQLAKQGSGSTAPNPMVGAVLVHKDLVIGEGFHQQYGHAHAEVNCINNVPAEYKHLVKESTLYVSLEPCNHFGKTPPCSDLIIAHQIPRVVIACSDPFEKVNGTGMEKLKAAGIDVITGILEKDAMELNKRFFTFHNKKRPYIILKWAQSNDLKIAGENYSPVKISNDITNRLVHKWRSEEASIMVGTNTALYDDPSLTTRLWPGKDPVRMVLDRYLRLPEQLKIFDDRVKTIIINTKKEEERGKKVFYKFEEEEQVTDVTVRILKQHHINSLLIEGGMKLLQSFIDCGLWDEARVITNKGLQIKNGITAPVLKNAQWLKTAVFQLDEINFYKNDDI